MPKTLNQTLKHIVELMEDNLEDHKDSIRLLKWPYNTFVIIHQWAKDELEGRLDPLPLIVVVEGGVVQEVINSDDEYYLLDWDNLKGGDTVTREFADLCVENGACSRLDIEECISEEDGN